MRHIPNILSFIRILLIPFFVWQMLDGNNLTAALILALSGVTDLLDGFLARRYNWISQLGKVLDPIADKLTQLTVCIVFIIILRRYWVFFAILLAKDFVMLVLGGYLIKKGVKMDGAKWFGKVATLVFYSVMTLILLIPTMPAWLITSLLCLATVCVIYAGLMYIPDFIRYRREQVK